MFNRVGIGDLSPCEVSLVRDIVPGKASQQPDKECPRVVIEKCCTENMEGADREPIGAISVTDTCRNREVSKVEWKPLVKM